MKELQKETPNSGGEYHFSELQIPPGTNLERRVQQYLLQHPRYADPYHRSPEHTFYVADRDVSNLMLKPIERIAQYLLKKLAYWRDHRTSLDRFEHYTERYPELENVFLDRLLQFIDAPDFKGAWEVNGIDTIYAIGRDHANDDTLFEFETRVFVLHFGWSS
ncbi:hypothetical protein [Flaviaesturariibacter amylovorans]|uniref:hypothetical protein n=1 Tax=Flaviaesturariibacter amylovorans TaxID=1084520 RepID=UPI0031ED2510